MISRVSSYKYFPRTTRLPRSTNFVLQWSSLGFYYGLCAIYSDAKLSWAICVTHAFMSPLTFWPRVCLYRSGKILWFRWFELRYRHILSYIKATLAKEFFSNCPKLRSAVLLNHYALLYIFYKRDPNRMCGISTDYMQRNFIVNLNIWALIIELIIFSAVVMIFAAVLNSSRLLSQF